jgi:Cytosine deaminase and related metal-dependent hydrolases
VKAVIIGNGTVITNDEKNTFIEDGAILVKGNLIVEVGKFKDLTRKHLDEEVIDVDKKLIMPGFICAHSHIYSAYARGMKVNKDTSGF